MKSHRYLTLIPYVCKILSANNDFTMYPYYVAYKIIGRFLWKLHRKVHQFRVYLGKNRVIGLFIELCDTKSLNLSFIYFIS